MTTSHRVSGDTTKLKTLSRASASAARRTVARMLRVGDGERLERHRRRPARRDVDAPRLDRAAVDLERDLDVRHGDVGCD